jgi:biopolymer transport protein ExbD
MIDVMMSLLIIFMVIQPGLRRGLDVQLPATTEPTASDERARDQLVLQVGSGPAFALNGIPVSHAQLGTRLREVFRTRARKVLFVRGGEDVAYRDVVAAIDSARGAGVEVIGLVPRSPPPGGSGAVSARAR